MQEQVLYNIGFGSPPSLKSPVLSHFKTDDRHVAKIKSTGYKDATPNTIFFSPKKSDHPLSFSPQQAFPLLFASLLLYNHCHLSIIGIEIKVYRKRRVKQDNGLGNKKEQKDLFNINKENVSQHYLVLVKGRKDKNICQKKF